MPYDMHPKGNGYVVMNKETGMQKNKKPMPHHEAMQYMKALYAAESKKNETKKSK